MIILNCDQHRNLSFVDKKYRILQGEHKFDVIKINMSESIDGVDDMQGVSIKMHFVSGNEHIDRQVVLENGYISTDIDYTLTEKSKRWLLYLAFYVNVDGEVEIGKTNAIAIQVNKLPYSDTLAKEYKEPEIVLIKGDKGDKGDPGEDGKSAYEIAVEHGYEGTEEEWLSEMKDYNELDNKPQINDHTLSGNQSADDLGLQDKLTAGENITISDDNVISAEGGGVTSYEDLTDKPYVTAGNDSGTLPHWQLSNGLNFDYNDFLGGMNSDGQIDIHMSWLFSKFHFEPLNYNFSLIGGTPYNGFLRIDESEVIVSNFPNALSEIDRAKEYLVFQAFDSNNNGNSKRTMLRKVIGQTITVDYLEFAQILVIDFYRGGKIVSQSDWVELTSGGSQIVSGVVNANGTITFTDSEGNSFTTSGSSVIGADGFSPSATVQQTASGATITVTDKNGTTTANISNGQDYVLTPQDKEDIADIVLAEFTGSIVNGELNTR